MLDQLATFIDTELKMTFESSDPQWVVIYHPQGPIEAVFGTFSTEDAALDFCQVQNMAEDDFEVAEITPPVGMGGMDG